MNIFEPREWSFLTIRMILEFHNFLTLRIIFELYSKLCGPHEQFFNCTGQLRTSEFSSDSSGYSKLSSLVQLLQIWSPPLFTWPMVWSRDAKRRWCLTIPSWDAKCWWFLTIPFLARREKNLACLLDHAKILPCTTWFLMQTKNWTTRNAQFHLFPRV
jgi:hypothetical protein